MFNFNSPGGNLVFLDPATGQVVATKPMNGNGNGGGN